ncbi:hypothetical protein ACJ41O_003533 [Fusarium nematophilum]
MSLMWSLLLTWLYVAKAVSSRQPQPDIVWGECIESLSAPGLQCANFSVPLDWSYPEGGQIRLGLARLPAKDPNNRIGNLFINPGGPGYSAAKEVADIALGTNGYTGDEIKQRFDIIGLDPRGVGISTRVLCDLDLWNKRVSLFPTDEVSYRKMVTHYRQLSSSCRNLTGNLMDSLDTIQVVEDLEAVRKALGDEELNWLGMSYGTQIGTQYAYLYPDNIRSMVLDSVLQHYQDEESMLLAEVTTYEATLTQFFDWCDSSKSCVLAGRNAAKIWKNLVAQAENKPIPAPGCTSICRPDVNAEELRFGAQPLLFKVSTWPDLASALLNATRGDATALATYFATGDPFNDSMLFTFLATICADWDQKSASFADIRQKHILAKVFAPFTKGASASYMVQAACIGWKTRVTNPPERVDIRGTPKVLVVNGLYDPSTSYAWALGVSKQFGDSAVVLTRNGAGHISYHIGGETSRAIDAYLVNLTLPEPGTVLDS